ncbi:MAG: acetylxylan esterase [Muribaculaceae bacterium]|nr:acetylxylan esterase [Muribaculaceae bacterium]
MKQILGFFAAALTTLSTFAGNYPDRSDFLWITVPDHTDWLYETGEPATVDVTLYEYGVPAAGKTVNFALGPDMLPADTTGTVILDAAGRARISMGTMTVPGFRDLRLEANFDGRRTDHHIKVGFSPEKLEPYTQNPADFDEFWAKALEEDAKTPLKYTVEPAPEYSTDKMTCQLVKLELPGPWVTSMYGYLFIPKGEGKYPAVLCPPGAGVKTIKDPLFHRYYGEGGMIRAEIEIHGADPRMSEAEFAELRKEKGAYLDFGMDSPEKYYMRDVYLGCRRWLDLLSQLPEFDGENLFVQGGSQGGALSITTSALDPRVKGCVANHPALSDMNGYLGPKTGGYPHHFRKNPADGTPDKVKTLEYYDVCNFARRLKCPVLMTWGYNDNTCPPTTSWEVWNLITSPKESLLTPINEHWTSANTERGHYNWIKAHCNTGK